MKGKKKGEAGYISNKRSKFLFLAAVLFGVAIILVAMGYIQTGSRKNMMTVIAILTCLPASYSVVEFFVMLPFRSISTKHYKEIVSKTELLTVSFDNLVSTAEKMHQVDALVITNNTVCGFTSNGKTNTAIVRDHIKDLLESHGYKKVTVKIFEDYKGFITRAEAMNSIESIDRSANKKVIRGIRSIIQSTCM